MMGAYCSLCCSSTSSSSKNSTPHILPSSSSPAISTPFISCYRMIYHLQYILSAFFNSPSFLILPPCTQSFGLFFFLPLPQLMELKQKLDIGRNIVKMALERIHKNLFYVQIVDCVLYLSGKILKLN